MSWKVSLHKVSEEEFSLYDTMMEAVVAAGELGKELGIEGARVFHLSVQQSPVTGELLVVDIMEVSDNV